MLLADNCCLICLLLHIIAVSEDCCCCCFVFCYCICIMLAAEVNIFYFALFFRVRRLAWIVCTLCTSRIVGVPRGRARGCAPWACPWVCPVGVPVGAPRGRARGRACGRAPWACPVGVPRGRARGRAPWACPVGVPRGRVQGISQDSRYCTWQISGHYRTCGINLFRINKSTHIYASSITFYPLRKLRHKFSRGLSCCGLHVDSRPSLQLRPVYMKQEKRLVFVLPSLDPSCEKKVHHYRIVTIVYSILL
jgi:hypothetical protein